MDVEARLELDAEALFSYSASIPKILASTTYVDSAGRLVPFMIDETLVRSKAEALGGRLLSFERKDRIDEVAVSARLSFPDPRAWAEYMDASGQGAAYAEGSGFKRMTILLAPGIAALEPDIKSYAAAALGGRRTSLSVRLPNPVKDPGIGTASRDGLELRFSAESLELGFRESALSWEFLW